jgi:predicted neuraminidase
MHLGRMPGITSSATGSAKKRHHVAYSIGEQNSLRTAHFFSEYQASNPSRGVRQRLEYLPGNKQLNPGSPGFNTMILTWILLIAAIAGPQAWQGDVVTERVFGAELPGPYKHPAAITELANGDLFLAYYGGTGEYAADSQDFGARLPKGSKKWTTPLAIRPRPKEPEGNPVVWQAPDGVIWLFSVVRPGETWSSSRIVARTSTDNAHTWSQPTYLTKEAGTMVRGKPIVLADGDYLLPVYIETGHDTEKVGPDTSSFFLRYNPKTKKWSESTRIRSRIGNLQPAVAELNKNDLIAFCRRGGDYEPRKDGFIVRSESHDGGKTWSEGLDTDFPNPNAAVDVVKLHNGHLILVFNDSFNQRTPLTVALSLDGGKTFKYRRNIAIENKDFAYPFAIQTKDDKIHIVYTTDRRGTILHSVFDEKALLPEGASLVK